MFSAAPMQVGLPQAAPTSTVVYSQPADSTGTIMKSSWYAPNGLDGDQYVWDNFTLKSAANIKEVDWTGGYTNYLSGAGKAPVSDFTVSIYPSIVGGWQPDIINGPVVQYQVGGNAGETASVVAGGVQLYNYKYVLPTQFHAQAGTKYWVQIEASQGVTSTYGWPPDWGLASASGGDNSNFREIIGGSMAGGNYYNFWSGDTAFSLVASTSNQTTPTINVSGGPYAYDGLTHVATAVAVGADGVTPVSGTFSYGYFQNGAAVSPADAGTYDVVANFTSTNPAYASTSGTGQITINKITPRFSNLSSPTINAGDANTTISGHLGAGSLATVGAFVGVTVGTSTVVAQVDGSGNFSAAFYTPWLAAGSYPITFACNGNVDFNAPANARSTLQVNPAAPRVFGNPYSQAVVAGHAVSFTASATGSPVATVQWQVSTDHGTTFTNISGATHTTLTFATSATQNGNQYRAVFKNPLGTATTAAAVLTVETLPVVNTSPVSRTAISGHSVTFTANATGNPAPTVQWQVSTDGGKTFTNLSGATHTTLTFTAASTQIGNRYRAVFTNAAGTTNSASALLTVQFVPTVTVNPVSQTVTAGTVVTFTAAATGNPTPTVQWQVSTDGGKTFSNISGATTTTLTLTAVKSHSGYYYRALFKNSIGLATSVKASLTVN